MLRSDIIFVGSPDDPSNVGSVGPDKEIMDMKFFDMQGREVVNPSKGIYVKTVKYSDGSVKTSKISVK